MTDQEIIDAMKTLLYPINKKLDDLEGELAEIKSDVSAMNARLVNSEKNIRQDIHRLKDAQETIIAALEYRKILPLAK